jgi:hypothetical protein
LSCLFEYAHINYNLRRRMAALLTQSCQAFGPQGNADDAPPTRIVSMEQLSQGDVLARATAPLDRDDARERASTDRDEAATPPPSPPKQDRTYVEGAVSVLARCRSAGPKLQWRPAAFSVDSQGHLRIFRSDEERRAWHAVGGDNIAKFHLAVSSQHAVSAVINADAPPSPPRGRVRFRNVLAEVREETSSDEGDESFASPRTPPSATRTERYCTFSVLKGPTCLLKFAAPPWRRRDLDALRGALCRCAVDVVPP